MFVILYFLSQAFLWHIYLNYSWFCFSSSKFPRCSSWPMKMPQKYTLPWNPSNYYSCVDSYNKPQSMSPFSQSSVCPHWWFSDLKTWWKPSTSSGMLVGGMKRRDWYITSRPGGLVWNSVVSPLQHWVKLHDYVTVSPSVGKLCSVLSGRKVCGLKALVFSK